MIEVITQLFEGSGFARKESDFGYLFNHVGSQKEDFWGMVKSDDVANFLDDQSRLLDQCSDVSADIALLKNLSMIILWETDGTVPSTELKRAVMQVEENPFFFKKYVLYFARSEHEELVAQLEGRDVLTFFQEQLTSTTFFQEYKKAPFSLSWQSLAYRIAVKLPFLSIVPKDNASLSSLEDKKNEKLSAHRQSEKLTRLEKVFFELMKRDGFDDGNVDAVTLLKNLSGSEEAGQ